MKVLCIDNKKFPSPYKSATNAGLLAEGEIYTVIDNGISKEGYPIYILKGLKSKSEEGGFWVERFIPISDIDETEMGRKENLQEA